MIDLNIFIDVRIGWTVFLQANSLTALNCTFFFTPGFLLLFVHQSTGITLCVFLSTFSSINDFQPQNSRQLHSLARRFLPALFNFSSFNEALVRIEFGFVRPVDSVELYLLFLIFSHSHPSPLLSSPVPLCHPAYLLLAFLIPVSLICSSHIVFELDVALGDPKSNPLLIFPSALYRSFSRDTPQRSNTHDVRVCLSHRAEILLFIVNVLHLK